MRGVSGEGSEGIERKLSIEGKAVENPLQSGTRKIAEDKKQVTRTVELDHEQVI